MAGIGCIAFGLLMPVITEAEGMATSTLLQDDLMLDMQTARSLATTFYQALNASSRDTIASLLSEATTQNWKNCSTNEYCQTREESVQRWSGRVEVIPDFKWVEKELIVGENSFVARGEVTGTPAKPFLNLAPAGKAFKIMTIDIHEVREGKISRSTHLEDWMSAFRQLSAPAETQGK